MSPAAPVVPARDLRPEIQALRAFAVLVVVLNHLWPRSVPGGFIGVDVFFVISGYLITAHLLREAISTGRVRLARFWARRARRLLPASMLVLVVCAGAVLALMPMGQWQVALRQIAASGFYLVNWQLLSESTDYFNSANSPSPVTHYWSLSVEEQFYIVWPLLILLALWIARRLKRRSTPVITVILALVFAASLLYSIALTASEPSAAYFSTFTRAWEFALGGLLALLIGERSLPERWAVWGSWLGWLGLFASLVLITDATPFPGTAALLPVVATALVIGAGSAAPAPNLNAVTSFAPLQFVGGISYSLYLWHWPLIILIPYVIGRDIGTVWRLAILIASILLAWMSKRFVEDPFRTSSVFARKPAWVTLTATAGAMVLILGITLPPTFAVDNSRESVGSELADLALAPPACFGALAAIPGADCPDSHTLAFPDVLLLSNTAQGPAVPPLEEVCSEPADTPLVRECVFGPAQADATVTVAVVGDSHALHYVAAMRKLAFEHGWRVKMVTKPGCPPIIDPAVLPLWAPESVSECGSWAEQAVQHVAADKEVDAVVFSSISREYGFADGTPPETQDISASYVATWQPWVDAGKQVLVIADTVFLQRGDILACLARANGAPDACSAEASVVLAKPDPMVVAAKMLPANQVGVFDPNSYICTADGICHAVVGGIPVFVDHNHLLQAFAATLSTPIADAHAQLEAKK